MSLNKLYGTIYGLKINIISNEYYCFFLTSPLAAIGPGIFLVIASYAGCNRTAVVAMLILGMGLMGTFYSGIKANSLDIAPNYAGVIMGFVKDEILLLIF